MVTKLLSHGPVATGKDARNAPSASGVAVIFSKLLMTSPTTTTTCPLGCGRGRRGRGRVNFTNSPYELAMRWTKGKRAFFMVSHTDRPHPYVHIYYNSTSLDRTRKCRDFLGSARAPRRLSDRVCLNPSATSRPTPGGRTSPTGSPARIPPSAAPDAAPPPPP